MSRRTLASSVAATKHTENGLFHIDRATDRRKSFSAQATSIGQTAVKPSKESLVTLKFFFSFESDQSFPWNFWKFTLAERSVLLVTGTHRPLRETAIESIELFIVDAFCVACSIESLPLYSFCPFVIRRPQKPLAHCKIQPENDFLWLRLRFVQSIDWLHALAVQTLRKRCSSRWFDWNNLSSIPSDHSFTCRVTSITMRFL